MPQFSDQANQIRFSAPAARNRQPILDVLMAVLPAAGTVLEIASGTGQHVAHFAAALPHLHWQPSDPDPDSRASISARIHAERLENIAEPLDLDVLAPWPIDQADAAIVANLLHISPPQVLPALMRGAGALLTDGCILHVYGPFKRHGKHTARSNAEFDGSLRSRNPDWGIRDLETVVNAASVEGFSRVDISELPANNFSLTFRKGG